MGKRIGVPDIAERPGELSGTHSAPGEPASGDDACRDRYGSALVIGGADLRRDDGGVGPVSGEALANVASRSVLA
jgi:hypothetical protein